MVKHVSENVTDKGLEYGWGSWAGQHNYMLTCRQLNAVFHSSPSMMQTRWYEFRRSNLILGLWSCNQESPSTTGEQGEGMTNNCTTPAGYQS